jgi:hypothetical protein
VPDVILLTGAELTLEVRTSGGALVARGVRQPPSDDEVDLLEQMIEKASGDDPDPDFRGFPAGARARERPGGRRGLLPEGQARRSAVLGRS